MKRLIFDLETTGTNHRKHSIHQIAALVELEGTVVDTINYKVRPHPKAKIDPIALDVCGVTEEEIRAYQPMEEVYSILLARLTEYVDRFDRTDKFVLMGYNILGFDIPFLRAWFQQNEDDYFGSWFWSGGIDVFSHASDYFGHKRYLMANLKLLTVAKELGIEVDDDQAHDALYDTRITREVYRAIKLQGLL